MHWHVLLPELHNKQTVLFKINLTNVYSSPKSMSFWIPTTYFGFRLFFKILNIENVSLPFIKILGFELRLF